MVHKYINKFPIFVILVTVVGFIVSFLLSRVESRFVSSDEEDAQKKS